MKKSGFTLAELLIAVGIIGVITAITIPLVNRYSPDKDKGMVLKAYKALNEINENILRDSSLYMMGTDIAGTTGTKCTSIVACTSAPFDSKYASNYSGAEKYPHLLSDNMSLSKAYAISNSKYTFTTSDGMSWELTAANATTNNINYSVKINVGNPARQNCTYNASSCRNPGIFSFKVDANGRVTADDSLTKVYLQNQMNLADRYNDLRLAYNMDGGSGSFLNGSSGNGGNGNGGNGNGGGNSGSGGNGGGPGAYGGGGETPVVVGTGTGGNTEELMNQLMGPMQNGITESLTKDLEGELQSKLKDRVGDEDLRKQLGEELSAKLKNMVNEKVGERLPKELEEALKKMSEEELKNEELMKKLEDEIKGKIEQEVKDELSKEMDKMIDEALAASGGGKGGKGK